MEPIDRAYKIFLEILPELEAGLSTSITEEDVRFRAINRILTDVLGWEHASINCEKRANKGFADYALRISDRCVMIIEAKRDPIDIGLSNIQNPKAYRLDGPVLISKVLKEGLAQAIEYSAYCGNELAVVSNGREWCIFRANRHADGKSIYDGSAFCFGSLTQVATNFRTFYELLSPENTKHFVFRSLFFQEEGTHTRSLVFKKALRQENSARLHKGDSLNRDLFTVFFKEMSGDDDPEMIAKCFVRTSQSEAAEQKISHIASEVLSKIKAIETDEARLLVERLEIAKETSRREFILLIGNKGAGKSTFVDRFFKHVLSEELTRDLVVARVDLKRSNGSEMVVAEWLDEALRDALEEKFYKTGIPTHDEMLGIFIRDYRYLVGGPWKPQYEQNKAAFKIEFGKFMDDERRLRPGEYVKKLLRVLVVSRKKLPVLVFDNADHFSIGFQERAFQYARSIYESEVCLVIVPITAKTSWQLSRQGALQSFVYEPFFLPTPKPAQVVETRVKYLNEKVEQASSRTSNDYFLSRGIRLGIEDIRKFAVQIEKLFFESKYISIWLEKLSNGDIRRVLELAREIIVSPYMRTDEIFMAWRDIKMVPEWRIIAAIVRGKHDIYVSQENRFIRNVFCISRSGEESPLLGVRLLLFLQEQPWKFEENERQSVRIDDLIDFFLVMHYEKRIVMEVLSELLASGLVLANDPTVIDIINAKTVAISVSGTQHLFWAKNGIEYISAMSEVTKIFSEESFEIMKRENFENMPRRKFLIAGRFLEYCLSEDMKFCNIPSSRDYVHQRSLENEIGFTLRRIEKIIRDFQSYSTKEGVVPEKITEGGGL